MYGENTGLLRAELATLLRQHRIQQRLGGKGLHSLLETTTVQQRWELGQQISQYRRGILIWCVQATRAASPHLSTDGSRGPARGPAGDLHRQLSAAITASSSEMPTLDKLATPQEFAMVESWRMAARAAALGEHDFGTAAQSGMLSDSQRLTVLQDAAAVTRGLVSLDRRYVRIPGWERLKGRDRLGQAAEDCAALTGDVEPDYSVDLRGWSPRLRAVVDGEPAQPGVAGILQAEHNLLVGLQRFPDAHSLRLVLDSQRIVSHEIAARVKAVDPLFAERCEARTETFGALIRETRDIRGLLGDGRPAAAQAGIVATRARKLPSAEDRDGDLLPQLGGLFDRVDARLADVVEHGAKRRLYLVREKLPHLSAHSEGLIHGPAAIYSPIDSPLHTEVLELAQTRLRPPPQPLEISPDAARSRLDFEKAIDHRPPVRGVRDVPRV
jgi:hypothetical protein